MTDYFIQKVYFNAICSSTFNISIEMSRTKGPAVLDVCLSAGRTHPKQHHQGLDGGGHPAGSIQPRQHHQGLDGSGHPAGSI